MLTASKAELLKDNFGNIEFLEQSYLWDYDQPKQNIINKDGREDNLNITRRTSESSRRSGFNRMISPRSNF